MSVLAVGTAYVCFGALVLVTAIRLSRKGILNEPIAPFKPEPKTPRPQSFLSQEERRALLDDLTGQELEGTWWNWVRRRKTQPDQALKTRLSEEALNIYEEYFRANGVAPSKDIIWTELQKREEIPEDSELSTWAIRMILRLLWIIAKWYW